MSLSKIIIIAPIGQAYILYLSNDILLAVTVILDGCAEAPATQVCSRSAEACVGPRLIGVKIEFDSL